MTASRIGPLRFTRGLHAYIVAPAYDGEGYIGIRDGRIIVRDQEQALVTRSLIMQREPQSVCWQDMQASGAPPRVLTVG